MKIKSGGAPFAAQALLLGDTAALHRENSVVENLQLKRKERKKERRLWRLLDRRNNR
jgi:hypothetical protein